ADRFDRVAPGFGMLVDRALPDHRGPGPAAGDVGGGPLLAREALELGEVPLERLDEEAPGGDATGIGLARGPRARVGETGGERSGPGGQLAGLGEPGVVRGDALVGCRPELARTLLEIRQPDDRGEAQVVGEVGARLAAARVGLGRGGARLAVEVECDA